MNREKVARELVRLAKELLARKPKYDVWMKHIIIKNINPKDSDAVDAALLKLYRQLGKNRRELESVGYDVRSVVNKKPVVTQNTVVVPVDFRGFIEDAEPVMREVLDKIR